VRENARLKPDFQGFEGYKVLNIMKTHAVSLDWVYSKEIFVAYIRATEIQVKPNTVG
jgi:hypothetical protein